MNYEELIANIKSRSNPDGLILEKAFATEMLDIKYGDVEKYVKLAMRGVEPAYTAQSRDAGERVKTHLKTVLNQVTYKYQGSVETNTHIKATSDIDLLVISDKSYMPDHNGINQMLRSQRGQLTQNSVQILERSVSPPHYQGDSLNDLKENRLNSERKLNNEYTDCDCSKPKAIQITNRSLNRDVDIVIAGWFDNANSILKNKEVEYRGIQIYNKTDHQREDADFPFLKIKLLNERSTLTNGRLKKMIRFLKNIKATINKDQNPEPVKLSSFQFNAICYNIETNKYKDKNVFELVAIVYWQLKSLVENSDHRDDLKSVDNSEYIFRHQPDRIKELQLLIQTIQPILIDLQNQKAV